MHASGFWKVSEFLGQVFACGCFSMKQEACHSVCVCVCVPKRMKLERLGLIYTMQQKCTPQISRRLGGTETLVCPVPCNHVLTSCEVLVHNLARYREMEAERGRNKYSETERIHEQ